MTELTLEITKVIHAPVEKVFDAWLDPIMLAKFMTPMPGMRESEVENDPRVGGRFTIIMHAGDEKLPHTGEYLEIDRPSKLVFTWGSQRSPQDSRVTLIFNRIDDHKTQVLLSQVKFYDDRARSDHEAGWGNILDKQNEIMP